MPKRYLFGPTNRAYAEGCLHGPRQRGECLAFDEAGTTDLCILPGDHWEDVLAKLPSDWRPDFVVIYPSYMSTPMCLLQAPVPVVAVATDWNLLWHQYRRQLPGCDLILTDAPGCDVFRREGLTQVRPAVLYGCPEPFLKHALPTGPRDIDILFVGSLHPAIQRERLAWLGRLSGLAERWNVAIHTGVFGEDYRKLLARARIVFNRSIRGECNLRAFEAAASGALLFQEANNREVFDFFRAGEECVAYTTENLEDLLHYYLENEDERQKIAEAGRARVSEYSFEKLWQRVIEDIIEPEREQLSGRCRQRRSPSTQEGLQARVWQALSRTEGSDPALASDLAASLNQQPQDADVHNALGLVVTLLQQRQGSVTAQMVGEALPYFERALLHDPMHLLAALNRTECLSALGQTKEAIDLARHTLTLLDRLPASNQALCDAGHFPVAFDHFRVEWERAAWSNAGQPEAEARAKRELIRWRLHFLLADLTGQPSHFFEAVLARPDLPITRGMLGCALGRAGQPLEAVPHLRQAVAANPFDAVAARALFQALAESGDVVGQRRFARARRLLAQAGPGLVPAEDWFVQTPPAGDELTSLLILCCNQLEFTRQCLESVWQHTRPPYELVIVDNGSTDGTSAYLEEIRTRPGPVRCHVIHNPENKGFPAGVNQALAQARGSYLVLLNNDVIVTEGWLQGLIGCSLHDWPKVGMVGAVTNYARPPQQIPIDYRTMPEMTAVAVRRRQEFAGQALPTERLTGFCLLARREALRKIGRLDEQFGLGFFDDDDLSVRAREAGYQLLVALDVFVHHFGSRTFRGLGIDCAAQLDGNFKRFKAKWGEQHVAGYRKPERVEVFPLAEKMISSSDDLPPHAPAPSPPAPLPRRTGERGERPLVSLCMIVKNEEANLPDCLTGLADLFDEIVIVDTGSTDQTRTVAERFGARVFDFPWVDSFAAARNESVRHAQGDWIFWLDADDRLDEANRQKLKALFTTLPRDEMVAYSLKCACLPDPVNRAVTVVDHIRLFPNHPEVRWKYRVHEQILPSIRQLDGQVSFADIVIQHTGYQDPALRGRKLERDLRLLHLEDRDQPDDPFTLFNLGSVYQELKSHADALPLLRRSLERSQPRDSIVRKLYALIALGHRQLGQPAQALAACEEGRRVYPDDTELLFHEASIRREQRDLAGAEGCLVRLLNGRESGYFASVDAGLKGYKARYSLAVIYYEMGRWPEAEAQWQQTLGEQPGFVPALLGLADLYLAQNRLDESVHAYRQAIELLPGEAYTHARHGEVLLQQGRLPEATACFREALRLQPTYAAAHSSLLLCLNYDSASTSDQLREEHTHWVKQHRAHPILGQAVDHDTNPHRHLRIGYVSPDFRRHVVAKFFEPILAHHDRSEVEVFCYADLASGDAITKRLQGYGDVWRSIAGLSDLEAAEAIQADRIDILVDLAGHTGNRLGIFARKPAPIQITYLGYPNTTGLETIDYRLGDFTTDPLETATPGSEAVRRLPDSFCCYQPPEGVPDVGPLPALRNGYLMFGSLQHLAKVNPSVLDCWSRILHALPSARLLIARHSLSGSTRDWLRARFGALGIPEDRLVLQQATTDGQHWNLYHDIDISLDPFPWSGHTSACESLWMGVPLVTRRGDRFAGRMAASILSQLDLTEWIAHSAAEYVACAVRHAADLDRLTELRAGLRQRMRSSSVCDGVKFVDSLERMYRSMWHDWIESAAPVMAASV